MAQRSAERRFPAEAIASEMPRNGKEPGLFKEQQDKRGWKLRVKGRRVGSEVGGVGAGELHTTALEGKVLSRDFVVIAVGS